MTFMLLRPIYCKVCGENRVMPRCNVCSKCLRARRSKRNHRRKGEGEHEITEDER